MSCYMRLDFVSLGPLDLTDTGAATDVTSAKTNRQMKDRHCRTSKRTLASWVWEASIAKTVDDATKCCDDLRRLSCESGMDAGLYHSAVLSCLNLMRSFRVDRCVQNSGLLAVAALCEKQQLSALIGDNGGVHQLLDAWNRFAGDDALVKNCVVTMRSLSETEQNREVFCVNNGIEKLMETLHTFPHRASIQIAAAVLIANLCFENEERRQRAIRNNAATLLINGLRQFDTPIHFRLHTNTCLALRNISVDKSGCDAILERDQDLQTIMKVIETSYSHSSTTRESLGILLNLAVQMGSANLSQSCVEGIIALLLGVLNKTLRHSSKYDECHEICFAAIRSFVNTTNSNRQLAFLSHRQQFFRLALMYAKEYMSSKSPLSVPIVTNICTCVRVLLVDSENRQCFSDACDGARILVQCILFLSNRPLHVEHALVALGNAVFDSSRGKEEARQSDGIRIVLDVMNQNYYISAVAEASLLAIHGICSLDERNGKIATEASAHKACVQTMSCFRDNPAIQERGLAAMLSLGTAPDVVKELKSVSALEIAQAATKAFPFSKAIAAQESKIRSLVEGEVTLDHNSQDRLTRRKKSFPLQTWKPFGRG